MKCRNFFLGEYFIKFFSLVDRFWGEITSKHNDICWLVKAIGHLDKVKKE